MVKIKMKKARTANVMRRTRLPEHYSLSKTVCPQQSVHYSLSTTVCPPQSVPWILYPVPSSSLNLALTLVTLALTMVTMVTMVTLALTLVTLALTLGPTDSFLRKRLRIRIERRYDVDLTLI